ncbi:flagellar hook-basal body complex protein FliE [Undibacterium terreum]|uniref:Flagellar hook-basal body complex protein FliE n=2 Tax=Undibacterium terreum TaxID=1224302 RepID=A0A916V0S7_9BURK|nr:flagellar hook-basal body complex protein FliE [Undibacterium terreum]
MGGIDTSRIDAMVAQLRAASARMEGGIPNPVSPATGSASKVDFADMLKGSLDQVNSMQVNADQLGQKFSLGDDKVSLSDVMISMQKANISFQTSIQVRNKLVSAYHDIMNMQI